jgi:phospholipid/cholesterol/gamma-HCH transport system ATP-binding protein
LEIQVTDLKKSFGENQVLSGVSLQVAPGRIAVIIGGSGSGKSVFLKHLIGLLRPDSGSIRIDGREIVGLSERELLPIRQRFGMIFQGGALLASLSVLDNVALGLIENAVTSRKEAFEQARAKLELVGLAEHVDKWPENLSGGMRKRAAIARALTLQPQCILYDEPTAGLDPPRARQIEDLILDVNRRTGATSVVVTHDMDCVHKIADHVYMLHQGRIEFDGSPEQLASSANPSVREFVER